VANKIQITGDFDGGNPKNPESIIQTAPNSFTIIPYSEDGDPNYKFRLDLKVLNNSSDTLKLDLTIDWQEPRFNHLRTYVYLKHSDDTNWSYHPMQVNRTQAQGIIECRAGETYVCLHPKYNYGDYLRFVAGIRENEFIKKQKIGLSPEGREVWLIKIGAEMERARKRIMLVSRIHSYETSGSFCIEGIIDNFIEHVSHFTFDIPPIFLLPMANPDGVYNGLCKRTETNGVDLSKELDLNDQTCSVLLQLIDSIQPEIYCEIHNWMLPDIDGIYFLNRFKAFRFIRHFRKEARWRKSWRVHFKKKLFATDSVGFKRYCRQKFGSTAFVLEFPWIGRSTRDMQAIGVATLKALAHL
jgi:hypothetical protein